MREGFKRLLGAFAAGKIAMESGDAMATQPVPEKVEHHESAREAADLAWARAARQKFDMRLEMIDDEEVDLGVVAADLAGVVRDFVREYNFPTQGRLMNTNQHNPMRILDPGEWRQVRDIAMHFMENASVWGKEYPGVQRQLTDVIRRIDAHLDEPGYRDTHRANYTSQGKIERSQGYK